MLFETDAVEVPAPPLTLCQNRPNPFNPETEIMYYLPEETHVVLEVFDVSGRCISRLIDAYQAKGLHRVAWRGTDGSGNQVASGVYFYRLRAGREVRAMKMVLLK